MNKLNPVWKPFYLNVADVKGFDTPFTIFVKDWDRDGSHDTIGCLKTSLREWSFGSFQQALFEPGEKESNSSRGAFSVDFITPLPHEVRTTFYTAYEICTAGMKLLAMDSGIGAKSDPFFELIVNDPNRNIDIVLYLNL